MDNLQGNIFIASQRLNDLTGYSGIEALKSSISNMEGELANCQEAVRSARIAYKTTIADRAASQREVTTLLARKDTWTPIDLERFTSLYRSDHGNEQAVQEAATKLADCERIAEQTASKLSSSILSRYHEEQIWSDKIRRMSTWGTWGLMGVNVLLFFVFQFGFEPWRRARLVKGFEEKVQEALEKEKLKHAEGHGQESVKGTESQEVGLDGIVAAGLQELEVGMDGTESAQPTVDVLAAVIESEASEKDAEGDSAEKPFAVRWNQPDTWQAGLQDLFSDRLVSLRKQDVTVIALEGAATGAALVGCVVIFLLRHS
jgi:sensitive to high expression protein 9